MLAYFEECERPRAKHATGSAPGTLGKLVQFQAFRERSVNPTIGPVLPRLRVRVNSVATAHLAGVFLPREVALVKKADAAGRRLKVAAWASAGRVGVRAVGSRSKLRVADRTGGETGAPTLIDEGHPCACVNCRE